MILAFILIVIYVNFVRYEELISYTSMFRLKDYLRNHLTIIYNLTIITIWIGVYILKSSIK